MLDVVASERHYAEHLVPIWLALTPQERGTWYVHHSIRAHCIGLGIPESAIITTRPPRGGGLVLVASFQDLRAVKPRPAVLVNHGAGQTYRGDAKAATHPSYTGGAERENVVLYLCPCEADAQACRIAHPQAEAVAMGVPKLDAWHRGQRGQLRVQAQSEDPLARGGEGTRTPAPDPGSGVKLSAVPTVAISWHANVTVCPESRSAWPHYGIEALRRLHDDPRWNLLGHAHPRLWPHLRGVYERLGIEATPDFCEVLDRADCYVIDNSSTATEFVSLDRPVVWMNAPWYRRDIDHGGRFWEWTKAGPTVDGPDELPDAITLALSDPQTYRDARAKVTAAVYAACDGHAAQRAADAIRATIERIGHGESLRAEDHAHARWAPLRRGGRRSAAGPAAPAGRQRGHDHDDA